MSVKDRICEFGRWLGVLATLAVAISLFVCSGEPTATPTSTPVPSPTPTSTPTPSPTPAPVSAADIDDDTTWQELFDGFTSAEQSCIRTEVGGELDSLLDERVMSDDGLPDWQVSLFECLTPETARSVYTSLVVAGMVNDETYDVSEQEIECVSAWVAGADVHRLIRSMAEDDLTVSGEVLSGVIPCLADVFLPDFLGEMGIDPDSLTEDELTCLNQWMVGYDWSNIMTAAFEGDLGIMGEFFPGLIGCAPGPFLELFFEDFEIDLDELTDDEKECLEDWLIDLNWDGIIAEISALAVVEGDEAYSILTEAFGLLACIPDLALDVNVSSGGPDDHGDTIDEATPIGIGESIEGVIGHGGDVDMFALSADAGQFYQIDVVLGTLDDSVLTVYDTDGLEVAYNDDYGDGTASRIVWSAPSSDVYYAEVSGFFSTGSYTLTVDAIEVTDDYPNSSDLVLSSIAPGQSIEGAIDYGGDVDMFELSADAGESYRIDVTLGTLEDSVLAVYDADGTEVAYNDDYGDESASRIMWEASATGAYYVEVSEYDSGTGSYTLTVALQ